MHRPFPARKTLGTRYNLRPATAPVEALRLQPGDVVVLEAECPVMVSRMRREHGHVEVMGRYVWQAAHDPHWHVGSFPYAQRIARAVPGEYRSPARPTDTNP
ncbi:hypothetical protein MN032_11885 [Agromyces atrinae]|uniref:hypothetical protein n=1 Tax=Agromyces atrinae TaxID=592376 RepID=UPI001F5798D0|nr:hypothetical protein [Agromyces atrinae]MCI2958394.1 hypothetical protein [Agromyces atrinae]